MAILGRQNTMAYHSKRDSTDVPSLFDDANVSLTGIHNHTEAKYRDVPNHPISRPFLGIPKAQNSILPLPQECPGKALQCSLNGIQLCTNKSE